MGTRLGKFFKPTSWLILLGLAGIAAFLIICLGRLSKVTVDEKWTGKSFAEISTALGKPYFEQRLPNGEVRKFYRRPVPRFRIQTRPLRLYSERQYVDVWLDAQSRIKFVHEQWRPQ